MKFLKKTAAILLAAGFAFFPVSKAFAEEAKKDELSLRKFIKEYDKNLTERKKSKFFYEFYWNPYPPKEEFWLYDWRTREMENRWAEKEIKKDLNEILTYTAEKFLSRIEWFKELERLYGGLSSVEVETKSDGQTDVRLPSTKRPADNIDLAIRTLEKEIEHLEKTDDPAVQNKKLELRENIETLKKNREKNRKFFAKFSIHGGGSGGTENLTDYQFNVSPNLKINFWGFESKISYEFPVDLQMKKFAGNNAFKVNVQKRFFNINWWSNYYTQRDGKQNIVELGGEKSYYGYDLKLNHSLDFDSENKTSLSAETVLWKKYGLGLNGNYDWKNDNAGINGFIKFKF